MSTDSRYTEVDLAIDVNEEVRLAPEAAQRLEAFLTARGVNAVRSSVHLNAWIGPFDKAWMVRRFLQTVFRERLALDDRRWVYVGDSVNDAPLFAAFALSVGVANVRSVLALLPHRPRFLTRPRRELGSRRWRAPCCGHGRARGEPGRLELQRGLGTPSPRRPPLGVPEGGGEAAQDSARQRGGPHRRGEVRRPRVLRPAEPHRRPGADPRLARGHRRGLLSPAGPLCLGAAERLLDRTDTDSFRLIHGESDGLPAWWPISTRARWC
jgi:hypothetical protein